MWWVSWGHVSEVNPGATMPEVMVALTNQGSGVSQGSLALSLMVLWEGLFWAAQGGELQSQWLV